MFHADRGRVAVPVRCAVVLIVVAVVAVALPRTVSADCGTQRSHRPVEDLFASDVVYLQEQGEVQLELKPARTRARGSRKTTLEADIEYGARDGWQLETEWEAREWTRSPDGTVTADVGDIGIGTRAGWRCLGGSPYHLSIGLDVSIPSDTIGDIGEATRHVGLAPSLIVARDIARTAQVFSSLEVFARVNRRRTGIADWDYASDTGMYVRMVRGFRLTAEFSVEGGPDRDNEVHVIPGVLWHRGDTIEIGVGLLTPVSHDTSRGVLAHVVCEFGGRHDAK
jgi:hypothetical protein